MALLMLVAGACMWNKVATHVAVSLINEALVWWQPRSSGAEILYTRHFDDHARSCGCFSDRFLTRIAVLSRNTSMHCSGQWY